MATHSTLTALFSAIADAIRAKTGSTAAIVADNFPSAIAALNVVNKYTFTISESTYASSLPTGTFTCVPGATWAAVYSSVGLAVSGSNLVKTWSVSGTDAKGIAYTTIYTATLTLAGAAVLTTDPVYDGATYGYSVTSTTT